MEVHKTLDHKNIVKLHEIIDDPMKNKIYMVMDYLPGGTLSDKLNQRGSGLPQDEVRKYFKESWTQSKEIDFEKYDLFGWQPLDSFENLFFIFK